LDSLSRIVAALKQTELTVQTQGALLDQIKQIIAVNWTRETLPEPLTRAPCSSLSGYLIV